MPGEKKGKVWQPPAVAKPAQDEDDEFMVATEWDDVLTNASESEIVELAGESVRRKQTLIDHARLLSYSRLHGFDQSSSVSCGYHRQGPAVDSRRMER